MKKTLKFILFIVLSFSVVACSTEITDQTKNGNEKQLFKDDNEVKSNDQAGYDQIQTMNAEQKLSDNRSSFIGKEDAVLLVREHLGLQGNDILHVEVDHEEDDKYIVHVYEIVQHEDFSHTATYGWYYVYKNTGKIEDMMR